MCQGPYLLTPNSTHSLPPTPARTYLAPAVGTFAIITQRARIAQEALFAQGRAIIFNSNSSSINFAAEYNGLPDTRGITFTHLPMCIYEYRENTSTAAAAAAAARYKCESGASLFDHCTLVIISGRVCILFSHCASQRARFGVLSYRGFSSA